MNGRIFIEDKNNPDSYI